jgi:hypothetical protein
VQHYAATTLIRPAFRERGFRRITMGPDESVIAVDEQLIFHQWRLLELLG